LAEVCRELGVTETTFYRWMRKFHGVGTRELRQLRDENRKLEQVVADLTLDRTVLQDALQKQVVRPAYRRELASWARKRFRFSQRRACRALGAALSSVRYRTVRPPPSRQAK
jgi:putative transposase